MPRRPRPHVLTASDQPNAVSLPRRSSRLSSPTPPVQQETGQTVSRSKRTPAEQAAARRAINRRAAKSWRDKQKAARAAQAPAPPHLRQSLHLGIDVVQRNEQGSKGARCGRPSSWIMLALLLHTKWLWLRLFWGVKECLHYLGLITCTLRRPKPLPWHSRTFARTWSKSMNRIEDHRHCRNALVTTMIGLDTHGLGLQRATADLMGLGYRNVQRATSRRLLAGSNSVSLFCGPPRAKRKNALTPCCIEDVLSFWIANTSTSSNRKDVRYRTAHDIDKSWDKRSLQFLQVTQTELLCNSS